MSNCGKIKILVVSANPVTTSFLSLEREKREIEEAIRYSPYRDFFTIEMLHAARITDLRRVFADPQRTPNILHFCGHGGGKKGLVFEDQDGTGKFVSGEGLAEFLSLFTECLECVVLNACYSEVQAMEIQKYVNCVIGMEESIDDESAIVFASTFYEALAAGRTYQFAYHYANKALALDSGLSKLHSVLLLRNNISPFGIDVPKRSFDTGFQAGGMSLESHLSRYNYDAQLSNLFGVSQDSFPYCGRELELENFLEMCKESRNAEPLVECIVVTGESGIGKSRFVYEISKKLPGEQWDSVWLPVSFFMGENETWRRINDWSYPKNILFVIDNISLVAESASRWLQYLIRDKTVTRKIVVVLIGCGGSKQQTESKFISMLVGEPEWMQVMRRNDFDAVFDSIGLSCESRMIYLDKPDRSDLADICLEYAKCHSCQISQLEISEILEKLEYLDQYMRPLFLFFLLDAWQEKEDWYRWNLENLLQYIKNSENRKLRVRFADQHDLYGKACNLMLLANIFNQINVTEDRLKKTDYFEKYCSCTDSEEYETVLGQLKMLGYYKNGVLCSNKAFLIGEFHVLCECMQKCADDKDFVPTLMSSLWQYDPFYTCTFLISVIGDYYVNSEKSDFKELFEGEWGLLYKPDISKELLSCYMIPYSLYMGRNKSIPSNKVLDEIKEMIHQDDENGIADMMWGSIVLTIATRRRDPQTRFFALEELRMLVKRQPDKCVIGNLIELLLQLTISADAEQTKEYIKEIKEYVQKDEQKDFLLQYVGALHNLMIKLPVSDAEAYMDEIYDLYRKNPSEGLKMKCCQALHNYYILQMAANGTKEEAVRAQKTFDQLKSLIDSGASTDRKILCYHCAYIKLIFHHADVQKMNEQEIEWAKDLFILLINNDSLSSYLNCGVVSFDDQGTLEVREDDKNSDYEVLSFFAAVVRNFMDTQGEYRNTMYEILTFIVDVTKEMPYFSYPFFLSLTTVMMKGNKAGFFPDFRYRISQIKSLLMKLTDDYHYQEFTVVFGAALMQTWNDYTESEQSEIIGLLEKMYRNNVGNEEFAKIYAHSLRLGCEFSDLILREKFYKCFKVLVKEKGNHETIICQFLAACESVILSERNEQSQKEIISSMCETVCDKEMESIKGLETFGIIVFRLDLCISQWLPELSKKLKRIGSSDFTVILIVVQAFYGLDKGQTLEWALDLIGGLSVYAKEDTVKNLVSEITSILSGQTEGNLEEALLQLIEVSCEVMKSYSYVDLTYHFKLTFPADMPDYHRAVKNLSYLQR